MKHCIVLDAVLESVVIFRVASRAVAEVVVPLGFAEACFFPRRPVVSGVGEQGAENAKAHAGVCACGGHAQGAVYRIQYINIL